MSTTDTLLGDGDFLLFCEADLSHSSQKLLWLSQAFSLGSVPLELFSSCISLKFMFIAFFHKKHECAPETLVLQPNCQPAHPTPCPWLITGATVERALSFHSLGSC